MQAIGCCCAALLNSCWAHFPQGPLRVVKRAVYKPKVFGKAMNSQCVAYQYPLNIDMCGISISTEAVYSPCAANLSAPALRLGLQPKTCFLQSNLFCCFSFFFDCPFCFDCTFCSARWCTASLASRPTEHGGLSEPEHFEAGVRFVRLSG